MERNQFIKDAAEKLLADGCPHSYGEIVCFVRQQAEGTELEGRVEVNNVWHSLRSMTREAGTPYQKVRRGFYQKGPPQRITAAPALEAPGGQSEIYQLMDQAIELLDRFESYSAKAREEQNLADGQEALAAIRRQVMRSLDDAVTGLSCWAAELEDLAEQPELDGPAPTM